MLPFSSHCMVRSGYMYCVSFGSGLTFFSTAPLFFGSHLFGVSLEEYMIWIVWEMTSGILSVLVLLVRQWIHVPASLQGYGEFHTLST